MHSFLCLAHRKHTGQANVLISNSSQAKAKSPPPTSQPLLFRHPTPLQSCYSAGRGCSIWGRRDARSLRLSVSTGEEEAPTSPASMSPVPPPRCRSEGGRGGQGRREEEQGRPCSPAGGGHARRREVAVLGEEGQRRKGTESTSADAKSTYTAIDWSCSAANLNNSLPKLFKPASYRKR
jgi:hypothetical protein